MEAIDPDAPGRKTVFKISTDKLPYSRNTPEACAYCDKKRAFGDDPLPLCTGCRSLRFCCREHQAAFWPQHKVFCQHQAKAQKAGEILEAKHQHNAPGSFSLQDRTRLAEDWTELHRHTLEEARAWALSISNSTIDYRSHYFRFHLRFRPESEGNPSTSFTLIDAELCDRSTSALGAHEISTLPGYLPLMESAINKERATGDKRFLGVFMCFYWIDNVQLWASASYVYDFELPSFRPEDRPWFWFPQYCSHLGLVFRIVGPGNNDWRPGLVKKKGNKWVWKEHNLEELAPHGIHITTRAVPRVGL